MRLLKTLAYWVIVFLGGSACFILQYSFAIDTGEEYTSFMFAGNIYSINYLSYFAGLLLFLGLYFLFWKFYLKADWKKYEDGQLIWKGIYVATVVLTIVALFFSAVLVMFCNTGFGEYRQGWLEAVLFIQLGYIVLLPIADLIVECRRKQ